MKKTGKVLIWKKFSETWEPDFKVKDSVIKDSDNERLLGVTVDANLNFNCHLENLLIKTNKIVHV